mgnify:CR=1 FL=1
MVLDLAKKGLTAEKIGEELKKQKIHSQEYGKKISNILKENNLYIIPDLKNVENKFKQQVKIVVFLSFNALKFFFP